MNDWEEVIAELTKQASDRGDVIELGWLAMRLLVPVGASAEQISDMRKCYFMGAQHLFASIMVMLDHEHSEPTLPDLNRMKSIHRELEKFRAEIKAEAEAAPD